MNVGGKIVAECPHCNGTGMCAHSVPVIHSTRHEKRRFGDKKDTYHKGRLECSKCGAGVMEEKDSYYFDNRHMSPPVCKVCGGKGFHSV